jgi:uncharacterized membrane protein YqjE
MFDQTPVNRLNGLSEHQRADSPDSEGDTGGVRRLLADITELVELQGRLVASDVKCLAEATIRPLILCAVSMLLMLGALPVLLLALANYFVVEFDWSLSLAQLFAASVAILLGSALSAVAVKKLMACGSPLSSSKAELEKNLDTVREMLGGKSAFDKHLQQMDRERNN